MNKKIGFIIKLFFLGVFVFLLVQKIDFHKFLNIVPLIQYSYIFSSLLFKIVAIVMSTFVLFFSIQMVSEKGKFANLFKIYFLSYFFNNIGVGSLGGDSYKWMVLNKSLPVKAQTTLALLTEKIVGLSSLISFVVISAFLYMAESFHIYYYFFVYPLSLSILFLSLFIFQKITRIVWFQKFHFFVSLNKYHFDFKNHDKIFIFAASFFSCLFYLCTIVSFFLIYTSLDSSLPVFLAFFVIPIVIFINSVPISFQGIGIREASIAFMFSYLGFTFEMGVTASIILLFVNIIISVLSGIYYIKEKHYIK